ncbi:hypothetical protein HMSSN036_65370 [Paenibacillus macerans]|nr:hypothetical protein HMSSN036_65370 [Paenibacillus macerans]
MGLGVFFFAAASYIGSGVLGLLQLELRGELCSGRFKRGALWGGSLEEAIFYGILEVAERDAFLITWYGQLPVPRLDPDSAEDRELRLMIERFKTVAEYEVYLFDMTMENRIPAILALAKSREPGNMNLICAAGSHLDPARAAKSAVHELGGLAAALNERFAERLDELPDMFHDPDLVLQMEDHALLNGLPQAEERFDFCWAASGRCGRLRNNLGGRPDIPI